MTHFTIRTATEADRKAILSMMRALWPDANVQELETDVERLLAGQASAGMAQVLLVAQGNGPVGFIHARLRSHADGCDDSGPVGYIEAWYVDEAARGQGVGGALVRAAEAWARGLGCREMASDTWADNARSRDAHAGLGYEVVDIVVNYRKWL